MFLTIFDYFRQILVAFKYFVQSDVLYNHSTKPGTAIQCKTKDSSCHRQNSVQVLSGIRAAQSSVFCVFFVDHCLSFCPFSFGHCIACPSSNYDFWTTLLASTNFSYLLTYTRTTILSQLSNLFHCNIYVKIYWRLQLFGIMNFLMVKD